MVPGAAVNKREARAEGTRNGYAIATDNAVSVANTWLQNPDRDGAVLDAIVNAALETEAEHFRQFSPFEQFSKALNDCGDRADGLWDAYESGVRQGAVKAAREFIATARVHLIDDPKPTSET
jgi:hypothetical protein